MRLAKAPHRLTPPQNPYYATNGPKQRRMNPNTTHQSNPLRHQNLLKQLQIEIQVNQVKLS